MSDAAFLKRWLEEIEQSQWLGPRALLKRQRRRLATLLRHARETVPFYRHRLDPLFGPGYRIDWERWNEIPVLTREDINVDREALKSTAGPIDDGAIDTKLTSGSSGSPLSVDRDAKMAIYSIGLVNRAHDWHRLDQTRKIAWIIPFKIGKAAYPDGDRCPYWSIGNEFLGVEGEMAMLNIATPVHQQIDWLKREQPAYLQTFPNNLAGLLRALERNGETLTSIETVWTLGETLPEGLREACRKWLGANIIDYYGCTEAGPIAMQCPLHDHHHVMAETVVLEVLDTDLQPCPPGTPGRATVTPLFNTAFPLIRYQLDDYIIPGERCDCGRGLPVITKILGRERNLFRFPDGSEVWPNLRAGIFLEHIDLTRWQVAQVGPLEIELRYVTERPGTERKLDELTAYIRAFFKQDLTVHYRPMETLDPPAGGKFHDYVCEL